MKIRRWHTLLVAMLAAALVGCTTAPYRELVPMGDDELADEVTRRLADDDVTGKYSFGVEARAGAVTLRGTILDSSVRTRAVGIVLGTQGVREVTDDMYP